MNSEIVVDERAAGGKHGRTRGTFIVPGMAIATRGILTRGRA